MRLLKNTIIGTGIGLIMIFGFGLCLVLVASFVMWDFSPIMRLISGPPDSELYFLIIRFCLVISFLASLFANIQFINRRMDDD